MFEMRANFYSFPSLPLIFVLNATNISFFVQVIQTKKAFDEDKVMATTSEMISDLLLNNNKSYLNDNNNKRTRLTNLISSYEVFNV